MSDTYLVVVQAGDDVLERALGWEQSYPLLKADLEGGDQVAAVLVRDTRKTSRDIADTILENDDEALCVVFDVGESPFSGRYYTALWEWLRKANGK